MTTIRAIRAGKMQLSRHFQTTTPVLQSISGQSHIHLTMYLRIPFHFIDASLAPARSVSKVIPVTRVSDVMGGSLTPAAAAASL